jgi:hypothetical protein
MKRLVAVLLALAVSVGCGGGEEPGGSQAGTVATKAPETNAVERLPWPPPTAESIVGKWSREGQQLIARFKPDGSFAFDDRANLKNPFTQGTYELEDSTMAFESELEGECRGGTWTWETGLDTEGSTDRLYVIFTKGGCLVPTGAKWTFSRVG